MTDHGLVVSDAGLARLRSGVGRLDDQVSAAFEIERLRAELEDWKAIAEAVGRGQG